MAGVPGLELPRQFVPIRAVESDFADHVAAAHERRHRFQQVAPAPQHADARRPAHLVAGKGQEITVQRLHIGGQMRHALRAIDQHQRAHLMRSRNHFFARAVIVPSTFDMEAMPTILVCFVNKASSAESIEVAFGIDGNITHLRADFSGHHLPGHDVAVMLRFRQQDFVARSEVGAPPRERDQIDRFRGIARENDLAARSGIDEPGDLLARAFVLLGRFFAQRVNAAMHVSVSGAIVMIHRFDHGAWLLR